MRDFLIVRNPLCDEWAARQSVRVQRVYEAAIAKLRGNPTNGTPIQDARDNRQGIRYPAERVWGVPQIEIICRIQGDSVHIIACRVA